MVAAKTSPCPVAAETAPVSAFNRTALIRVLATAAILTACAISLLGFTTAAHAVDTATDAKAESTANDNGNGSDTDSTNAEDAPTNELLQKVDQVVDAVEADPAYQAYQHLVQVMTELENQDLTDLDKDAAESAVQDLANALDILQGSGVNSTVAAGIQQILASLNDVRNGVVSLGELCTKLHGETWLVDYDELADLVEQTKVVDEAITLTEIETLLNKASEVTNSPAASAAVAQANQSATVVRQTGKTTIHRATASSAGKVNASCANGNANCNNVPADIASSDLDMQVASTNPASAAVVTDGEAADLPAAADALATTANLPLSSTLAHVTTALAAAGTLSVTDYATKRQKSKKQAK